MKILRNKPFYVRYQHLIMGVLWLITLGIYFRYDDPFQLLAIGGLLIALGEISLQLYYIKKGRAEDSIIWNKERLIIQELFQKPRVYPLDEAHFINLTKDHLVVKAPKAAGTMLELNGFEPEDLEKLQQRFSS